MTVERADLSASLRIERPAPEPAVNGHSSPRDKNGNGASSKKDAPRRRSLPAEEPKASDSSEEDSEPPQHRIDDLA